MSRKRVANIINFIRGEDPRVEQNVLYETFKNQIDLCHEYPMPYTFLMQYDAFIKPEYAELLKNNDDSNMEIGVWIELAREQIEKIGLEWKGNPDWKWDWHATPDLLVAYTREERKLLIDELMEKFREIFGFYPKSVGSWMLDSFSVEYLTENYDIDSMIICREQYGTDGYTLWGGYYNGAYFPSRKNMFMPAQSEDEQIHTPVFRLLGIDHLHQYDIDHVTTLEPAWECGQDEEWVDWYFKSNFEEENISFSYTQVGQENPFEWQRFGEALKMQTKKLYNFYRDNRLEVLTLGDTGKWFKEAYKMTPAASITSLEDWMGKGCQTVWYNCKNYRINFYNDEGFLAIRDIQLFDENYEDRYLFGKTEEHWAIYDALPIIDGYRWGDATAKSYLYFADTCVNGRLNGSINNATKNGESGLIIDFQTSGGNIECVLDEEAVTIKTQNSNFGLLFRYTDLMDSEILSIEDYAVNYRHNGKEYSLKLNNAKFITCEKGFEIIPDGNEFIISFGR